VLEKRSTIANYLRLKLDPIIQTGIRDGFISMGHGRAIINIEDLDIQTDIYQKIVSKTFLSGIQKRWSRTIKIA
jgi:ParB family chromosome partitioning protein